MDKGWSHLAKRFDGASPWNEIHSYIASTPTEVTRVHETMVPVLLAIFGPGMIVVNMAGAWLADRGVMRPIGVAMALNLVAQACFFFTPVSLPAVTINIFQIGVTSMGLGPALQTCLLDVAPNAQMLAASLNHFAYNVTNALGAWLGGAVIAAGFG